MAADAVCQHVFLGPIVNGRRPSARDDLLSEKENKTIKKPVQIPVRKTPKIRVEIAQDQTEKQNQEQKQKHRIMTTTTNIIRNTGIIYLAHMIRIRNG